ncbi:MAG TPA: DNA polymerase III subunit gamma/tau [Vicinamibacteria bacterium]|nr:DNA polymerase III subunit gamma/tau [Vicinamibacteria bacterium]
MTYEVLALKYRPAVFEDLIGQEAICRTLTNAIQKGRVAHAFLFAGVRGVGKTTTARILAKALNCQSGPTVRPCGKCDACREIAAGRSMDVLEIDGASHTKVEEFRELLETVPYAPSRDKYKIYIVDEVHMLSTHSFNALLKTLEEPPPHVKFIFATTEQHKIPDTIRSRCQEFEFRTVAPSEIAAQLQKIADAEGMEIDDAAIAAIARVASGSLRDGISALDQVSAASGKRIGETDVTELLGLIERDVLRETLKAIVERDTAAILKTVDRIVSGGRDLRYFTSALMQYIRDVLVTRVAPDADELLEVPSERPELESLAGSLSEEDLVRSLHVLAEAELALRSSPEPRFHLEIALLKLSQLGRLASFEELLRRFEDLVSGNPPPVASNEPRKTSGPSPLAPPRPPAKAGNAETDPVKSLVDKLKTSKPMLHALVSRHERAQLEDGRLRLVYAADQKVIAEQLDEKELRTLLATQLSQLVGRDISVVVEVDDPRKLEPLSPDRNSVRSQAEDDPLVQRFVDTFQGEVEDVLPGIE